MCESKSDKRDAERVVGDKVVQVNTSFLFVLEQHEWLWGWAELGSDRQLGSIATYYK